MSHCVVAVVVVAVMVLVKLTLAVIGTVVGLPQFSSVQFRGKFPQTLDWTDGPV